MFLIKQVLEENNIIPNNDSNNQSDDTEKKLNVKQVLDTKIKNKIDYENIIQSIVKYNDNNKIIAGLSHILGYLRPQEKEINRVATNNNMEPQAFFSYEMGSSLSDNYSYLDMSPEDLSAKGNGGLRQMYNYATPDYSNTINTPEDKAVSNMGVEPGSFFDLSIKNAPLR